MPTGKFGELGATIEASSEPVFVFDRELHQTDTIRLLLQKA